MQISKHSHSCLLVQENSKVILIDPGNYTVMDKSLDVSSLSQLDAILITHEHQDHMDTSLLKELVAKFPEVKVVANASIKEILGKEGITVVDTFEGVESLPIAHERMFIGNPPTNTQFTIFSKLSHPGDSFQVVKTAEVLALPIQAPWGSLVQAVELAVKLKPKVIIPIHDWHLNEAARETFYSWLENFFSSQGIEFKKVKNGEVITV